ncbi:GRIP and coiled-coil domain-containing protein 2-like [Uranotaenia lowii]|uniref:GRIP and coiled-coil domain-containing protein 2-like n=1 Tax=Uranotaenia lowii TaxID=190385 RepID=UPI0024785196|nr:GRIP and coiled-coil domain-containing protein 2-like [Uranotaenia lowii]
MDTSQSTSAEHDSATKKASPFDNLTRDDLVKKCRGLLGIAQKAKQAKDEAQEEIKQLKDQLNQAAAQKTADKDCLRAMQEVVDSLTEQKLQSAMRVDELQKSTVQLRGELEKLSDENEAFQRQIKRATEENEELLGNLSQMEQKLKDSEQDAAKAKGEVSGKEEKLIRKLKLYKNKVQEISAKLMLLKSDRKILMKTVKEYSEQVPKWQKELMNASGIVFKKTQQLEIENQKLQQQVEELNKLNEKPSVEEGAYAELHSKVSEQEAIINQLNEQLSGIAEKDEHISIQLNQIRQLESEADEYKKRLDQYAEEKDNANNSLNACKLTLEELQKASALKVSDLENKLHSEVKQKESHLKDLQRLQEDLEKSVQENEKLQAAAKKSDSNPAMEELQKRYRELEHAKLTLEHEKRTLIEKIKTIQASTVLAELQTHLDQLQQRCSSQTEELDIKRKELSDLENANNQLQSQLEELHENYKTEAATKDSQLSDLEKKLANEREENEKLHQSLQAASISEELQNELRTKSNRLSELELSLQTERDKIVTFESKIDSFESSFQQLGVQNQDLKQKLTQSIFDQEKLQKKLMETSSALETLQGHYNMLTSENQQLHSAYSQLSQDHSTCNEDINTLRSKLELTKLENSELLSELKEINEILKERGGVISLQLSKISDLESQKQTLQQKLNELDCPDIAQLRLRNQELEQQLSEKETELGQLRASVGDRSFDGQSDVMSTSTISRLEEAGRMRDLEDSFEEKYNKLRALAVRLKKKVSEQTLTLQQYEKERESKAVAGGKNLQSLQAEYDKLLDQLEGERQRNETLEAELKCAKTSADSGKTLEDASAHQREQELSLKREKEAFNLVKKEIEAENQKLKNALKAKEKQFTDELESQKELKAELEKLRLAAKKANVLNLEMEAYEKSLAELNRKLEAKKEQVKELEGNLEAQEGTTKSLKSQIALLEQSLSGERSHSQELKKNVDLQQEKLRVSEHQRGELNVELAQLKVDFERIKIEMETGKVELNEAITEKEKSCGVFEAEKSKILKQVYSLESELSSLKETLAEKEQELEDNKAEFASYKIRAQSVLRQNQSKDNSREQELMEEVETVRKTLEVTQSKFQTFSQQLMDANKSCEELKADKVRLQARCKELHELLEVGRLQNETLMEEIRGSNLNHQEALKTQRLQNETLVNCYKKQLEDMQEKHTQELKELQSQIKQQQPRDVMDSTDSKNNNFQPGLLGPIPKGQHISDEQKISLLLMEREECEGSESTSSQNGATGGTHRKISNSSHHQQLRSQRSNRDLIPLDELLNSSFDDGSSVLYGDGVDDENNSPSQLVGRTVSPTVELQQTRGLLTKQESRVRHLTALLAEAEQDLAKLTQLNELLKEEVRRHERAIEREKHVHNSEYLKNVIFKFLTLNSGDERSHLVPVLNTILRLSPEETQKLNNVARGTESGGRGWTGILWN